MRASQASRQRLNGPTHVYGALVSRRGTQQSARWRHRPGRRGSRHVRTEVETVAGVGDETEGDERIGLRILRSALEAPLRQIAENSGHDGGVIVEHLRDQDGSVGFDAGRSEMVDLVDAGIIDPTKVVRTALENAASVAGVLLLTEATLVEVEDEDESSGERAFS